MIINFKNKTPKVRIMKSYKVTWALVCGALAFFALIYFSINRYYLMRGEQPFNGVEVSSNDFIFSFKKPVDFIGTLKTGGVIAQNGGFRVFEQSDLLKILKEHGYTDFSNDMVPTLEKNGGIKKLFYFDQRLLALVSVKNKISGCYSASLINLSSNFEVFQAPCLPVEKEVDFNGIGGAYAELDGSLLMALGTPALDYDLISNLAQDFSSPYGKVLEFPEVRFQKSNDLYKFDIYSLGHRNSQGMYVLGGKIYSVEQGPRGGDKINILVRNKNYGWPIATFGSKYREETRYTTSFAENGFQSPLFSFIPSVAASDIIECPSIIAARFSSYDCLLISTLRAKSLFIAIIDRSHGSLMSLEQVYVGARIRQFLVVGSRLLVSTDFFGTFEVLINPFIPNPVRK